jgi:hypothetical protein
LLSFLVVAAMVLGSFGTAKADSIDNPTVTPVSGDKVFTTEVIPVPNLPGTTLLDQKYIPVGFKAGEVQFGGNGVLVKGMDFGKATVCYSIREAEVNQGWGGKVGMWNGTKWVLLPTTLTTPDEAVFGTACATITGSGTYAFIKMIVDAKLLPTSLPECTFGIGVYISTYDFENSWFSFQLPLDTPLGTIISYQVLSVNPTNGFSGPFTGSVVMDSVSHRALLDDLIINPNTGIHPGVILLTLPTCQKTFSIDVYFPN